MTVKDLIEQLQDMPQDALVYVYADHGQSPQKAAAPEVYWTDQLDYCLFDNWSARDDDVKENGFVPQQFVMI